MQYLPATKYQPNVYGILEHENNNNWQILCVTSYYHAMCKKKLHCLLTLLSVTADKWVIPRLQNLWGVSLRDGGRSANVRLSLSNHSRHRNIIQVTETLSKAQKHCTWHRNIINVTETFSKTQKHYTGHRNIIQWYYSFKIWKLIKSCSHNFPFPKMIDYKNLLKERKTLKHNLLVFGFPQKSIEEVYKIHVILSQELLSVCFFRFLPSCIIAFTLNFSIK